MKKIKICFLHNCVDGVDKALKDLGIRKESFPVEFVWEDEEPDVLIATELIYTDIFMYNKFCKLYNKARVCIYRAGECIAPDMNLFDYAIVLDKNLKCEDRIIKMPTRLFFSDYIFQKENVMVGKEAYIRRKIQDKKFCNYIYSNGFGHNNRTRIFHLLNDYKHVDSLGKYLHNTDDELKVDSGLGFRLMIKECIEVKENYKFSVAFENATYNGYTSEKIFSSLEAHTVPIYWGNPLIGEEINPNAFINCHDFTSLEEVIEEVKRIDCDDELWIKMVCSPWKTKEQEERERVEIEEYYEYIEHIFTQPIDKARRRGEGFHPNRYQEWFFQTQANNYKFQCYHDVEIKWIENLRKGKSVGEYFRKNGYKSVVIYGMGQLGIALFDEIKLLRDVSVLYAIDQGSPKVSDELEVYKMDQIVNKEKPDIIVITVPHLVSQIETELRKVYACKCISILNVVSDCV